MQPLAFGADDEHQRSAVVELGVDRRRTAAEADDPEAKVFTGVGRLRQVRDTGITQVLRGPGRRLHHRRGDLRRTVMGGYDPAHAGRLGRPADGAEVLWI